MSRLIITVCCILIYSISIYAQDVQTPLAPDSKIATIDKELAKKLGLFTEYPDISSIILFEAPDNTLVLEISYKIDGKLARMRKQLSQSELEELRKTIESKLREVQPGLLLNQEGRIKLLASSLTLGLSAWGWMLPAGFDVDDSKLTVAMYLLTSAGSFFIPYYMTKDAQVTDASALLSFFGGVSGVMNGNFPYQFFSEEKRYTDEWGYDYVEYDFENMCISMALTSMIESIAGYYIADLTKMKEGKAVLIAGLGAYGYGYGLGVSTLAEADFDDFKSVAGTMVLGNIAGMIAGNFIANQQNYTSGDALLTLNGGLVGTMVPLSIIAFSEPDDEKTVAGLLMAGNALGLFAGDMLVRGYDFSLGQGNLITLGTLAGGFLGGGIGYIVSPDDDKDVFKSVSSLSAIGAGLGLGIMYYNFKDDAEIDKKMGQLNFDINPMGLLYSLKNNSFSQFQNYIIPVLNISYRF